MSSSLLVNKKSLTNIDTTNRLLTSKITVDSSHSTAQNCILTNQKHPQHFPSNTSTPLKDLLTGELTLYINYKP